jgi:hypothetical protein
MKKLFLSTLSVLVTAILVNAQDITSYRGAFAPAPEPMWTDSWTNWDPQNVAYGASTVTVNAAITTNTTWTSNNVYLIQGIIYVNSGATLTIQPGTVIRGDNTVPNSSLFVARGGKINAIGTVCNPIVFTSNKAIGARAVGDWGGIVLLGNAKNNQGLNVQIEGTAAGEPRNFHGGTNDDDNSGTLKYVRIEFGGFVFAPNNEINGLTLGSVGRGTTIDYVQTSFINDDAFEWFGGTVNCKHLVAYRCLDDDFDTDFGFSGSLQYGLSIKDPAISDNPAVSTSEGFESDNDAAGSTLTPKTSAKFYNITHLGGFRCASNTNGSGLPPTASGFRRGARIRRNSDLKIVNSIFMGDRRGLFLDGAAVLQNIDEDSAVFRNNIFASDYTTSFTSPSGNGVLNVAEDQTTRTRLFAIDYANDSVNTCSLLTNAWNFLNPDYRPNAAGAGAIVVDPTNLAIGADLTPFIEIDNGLFTAGQSQDFAGDVLENGGGASNGTITITIPKLSGWNIGVKGIVLVPNGPTVPGVATSITLNGGPTPVDNANWNFKDDGTNIIATSKVGVILAKGGFRQIGFTATRIAPTGTNQNLGVNVSGGGDNTPANNLAVTVFSAN